MIKSRSEQGSALMLVMIIVLILVGISGAYMSLSWWNTKRAAQDEDAAQALYIAESGAAAYINYMNANTSTVLTPPVRTKQFLAGGYWWVPTENIVDFADSASVGTNNYDKDYASFQVAGRYNKTVRRVNVLVTHKAGGAFWNAIFAGNKGNDPNYTLNLTGSTATGRYDTIKGDIYTGNGINATGDAQLQNEAGNGQGKVTYKNTNTSTVTGPSYTQGAEPDLEIPRTFGPSANMTQAEANAKYNYTNGARDANGVAWVDVAGQFSNTSVATAGNQWAADNNSSATDILSTSNPAHIFRKDPSVRGGSTNRTQSYEHSIDTRTVVDNTTVPGTPKPRSDYYLEDPTNSVLTTTSLTGHAVNSDTTASMLNVDVATGNNAVYFIDGNLRVSGENVKSYQISPSTVGTPIKMTMIVKGNVSLTDNLLYPNWESTTDALAIIAITDPAFPNTTAAQFAVSSGSTVLTPNGVSIDTFVTAYNARAAASGVNMPPLNLPADAARASQEYNKIYGSGNVFFGDPGSGTVEHFEAFMYAENNFYATNLDSTTASGGTGRLEIYGNMTAGNQVSIDRSTTAAGYIPLKVTFDPIIKNNGAPPGLPAAASVAGQDWRIATWKQSTNTAETGGDK